MDLASTLFGTLLEYLDCMDMRSAKVKFIFFLMVPLLAGLPKRFSYRIKGICERVIDGDTAIVSGRRIRLLYIDAPENKQWDRKGFRAVGKISTEYLRRKCLGQKVTVKILGRDRYSRYLGEIFKKETSLNLMMIKNGMAFIYDYAKFENYQQKIQYVKNFKTARKIKKGIFKTSVLKPITYRRKQRKRRKK